MAKDLGRPVRIESFSKSCRTRPALEAGDPKASCRLFCPPRRRAHVRPEGAKRDSDSQAAATQQPTAPLQLPAETMPCSRARIASLKICQAFSTCFVMSIPPSLNRQRMAAGWIMPRNINETVDGSSSGRIGRPPDRAVRSRPRASDPFYHFVNSGLPPGWATNISSEKTMRGIPSFSRISRAWRIINRRRHSRASTFSVQASVTLPISLPRIRSRTASRSSSLLLKWRYIAEAQDPHGGDRARLSPRRPYAPRCQRGLGKLLLSDRGVELFPGHDRCESVLTVSYF